MATPKKEVAFIDRGISDLETFLAGLRPEVEAIVLSDHEAAPRQMVLAYGRAAEFVFMGDISPDPRLSVTRNELQEQA